MPKISALPAASSLAGTDEFAANSAGGTPTSRVTANQIQTFVLDSFAPATSTVFVAKTGSDANSGLVEYLPVLTIGAAITAAASLISGGAPRVRIDVLDGGTYTEDITVAATMILWAPAAALVGKITLNTGGAVRLHQHYTASNNQTAVQLSGASGPAHYEAATLDIRGTGGALTGCDGLRNITNGGVLFARVGLLFVCADGSGIGDAGGPSFGHIHFTVGDLYLGGNNAIGINATAANTNLIGYVDHCLEIGGTPTGSVGIIVSNASAIVKIVLAELVADTAYNISAGSLHIVTGRLSGARTGTPAFEISDQMTLPVARGGTGVGTLTGLVKGAGTAAFAAASAGTDYVAPGAVTTSGLTQATARLLGRTTASTGAVEEITVGAGLTLSAGSLTAAGAAVAGSWVEISRATASASATVDFTGLSTTYDEYCVALYNVTPANDDKTLGLLFSTDNGSTFPSGTSNYANVGYGANAATIAQYRNAASAYFALNFVSDFGAGNATNENGVSGQAYIIKPGVSAFTHMWGETVEISSDGGASRQSFGGVYKSTTAVDAIRFYFDTGNIASGVFVLLGRKK